MPYTVIVKKRYIHLPAQCPGHGKGGKSHDQHYNHSSIRRCSRNEVEFFLKTLQFSQIDCINKYQLQFV